MKKNLVLFSRPDCKKCTYIKEAVDLNKLGVKVEDVTDKEGLSHLAWHELVTLTETTLPILVLDDMSIVTGAIAIKKYLLGLRGR